jgi:hypothetical protein
MHYSDPLQFTEALAKKNLQTKSSSHRVLAEARRSGVEESPGRINVSSLFETREDCTFGGHREKTIVVPIPALRLVYIENRRAASESIRSALRRFFNATWDYCRRPHCGPRSCLSFGRCTSECLPTIDPEERWFTFTFVRNPVSRFYSGVGAYMERHPASTFHRHSNLTAPMAYLLRNGGTAMDRCPANAQQASSARLMSDPHTWSQAVSLSGFLSKPLHESHSAHLRQIDFIGRVERLADSFDAMLRLANTSNTAAYGRMTFMPQDLDRLRGLLGGTRLHASNTILKWASKIERSRTADLDAAVARSFAQDMVCFGYVLP